jgi:hypothetical protein
VKAGEDMLPWIVIGLAMVYLLVILPGLRKNEESSLEDIEPVHDKEKALSAKDQSDKDRLQVFREYISDADWQDDQNPRE